MKKATFKMGDKVYCPSVNTKISIVREFGQVLSLSFGKCHVPFDNNGIGTITQMPVVFHATAENHALLERLYGVEFEAPPKQKTPKEIIQAMLDDGWIGVACYVNDTDKRPSKHNKKDLIVDIHDVNDGYIFVGNAYNWKGANPFDPKTGKAIIDYVDGEIVTE